MPARPVEAREAPHSVSGWGEELPSLDADRPFADRSFADRSFADCFIHPLEGAEGRWLLTAQWEGVPQLAFVRGETTSLTQLLTQSREPMDDSNDDGQFDGPWKSGLN